MIYYNHRSKHLTYHSKGVFTMKENTRKVTMDFIENRDIIKKAIKLEARTSIPLQQIYSARQV